VMNYSRRKFIKTGVVATAFAGVPLNLVMAGQPSGSSKKSPTGVQPSVQPNTLVYFNKSTFTPYVNTKFRVYLSSPSVVSLTLLEVVDHPVTSENQQAAQGGECFSLQFTGSSLKAFNQKTYRVDHPALGEFSMFLVPVSPRTGTGPLHYEAVINRRLQ
jgi:hypothetical protein